MCGGEGAAAWHGSPFAHLLLLLCGVPQQWGAVVFHPGPVGAVMRLGSLQNHRGLVF